MSERTLEHLRDRLIPLPASPTTLNIYGLHNRQSYSIELD
jgi:hypothetical protein